MWGVMMTNIEKLKEAMRLIKEVEGSCKRNTKLCLKSSEGYIGNAIKWESSRRIR